MQTSPLFVFHGPQRRSSTACTDSFVAPSGLLCTIYSRSGLFLWLTIIIEELIIIRKLKRNKKRNKILIYNAQFKIEQEKL